MGANFFGMNANFCVMFWEAFFRLGRRPEPGSKCSLTCHIFRLMLGECSRECSVVSRRWEGDPNRRWHWVRSPALRCAGKGIAALVERGKETGTAEGWYFSCCRGYEFCFIWYEFCSFLYEFCFILYVFCFVFGEKPRYSAEKRGPMGRKTGICGNVFT